MLFRQLFDPTSSTYTYLLADEDTREAVIIDPVIDQLDRDTQLIKELGLTLLYTLDTHVHADHVTASGSLANRLGTKTVLSERSGVGCADVLVKNGDFISFGRYQLEVRETPGHTDGCLTFVTGDEKMAFTGDALLIRGSGRTDFQQGNSRKLYHSVHEKIFTLADDAIVYPGHNYKGRMSSSVGEEKRWNPRLGQGKTIEQYTEIMANLQLPPPKQLAVAVPANLHCGVPRDVPHDAEAPAEKRWAPIEVSGADVPEVTVDWVAANPTAGRLIDVREVDEYVGNLGHIDSAELVSLGTLAHVAAAWDRAAPVVLVCRSGGRSAKAAMEMRALGFKKVASMRGGMTRWNESHLPVVRTPSIAPS
jgi:glyoxylase-like metal-dependent hydrolase (beta-lactamase superfamily II)/rhodanese-related sulfurtransferase